MNILPLNTLFAGACVLGAMAFVPAAQASLIVSESFDYASGALAGGTGGTGWSGAWTAFGNGSSATVQTGSLGYTAGSDDLLTAGNKAYVTTTSGTSGVSRTLASGFSDATTHTVYLSFTFNWDEGTRFFGLQLYNGGTSVAEFNKLSGQTNFRIQSATSGGTAIVTDTTYLAVVRIDFNASGNDTLSLFINPSSFDTEPVTASSSISAASLGFDTIRLATGFTSGSFTTAAAAFDEIRIGTSYADVVPSAIPEPASAAALLGVAALGAMGAGRRRR